MFFWYQKTGGEDAWHVTSSAYRSKVISEIKPAFVTVLDAHEVPEEDTWGREEYAKMRYSGPLYFDWDAESVEDAIPPLREFLGNLESNGVDLQCLRLYATGGRGFHCEIPDGVLTAKPAKTGYTLLPYVYKEMALELATDLMDLRVYTGRRGRMWRVPNVVRTNGKYKVSITLDEALEMTPELYDQVCSAPRAEVPRSEPTPSIFLGGLFDKARATVDKALKNRAKAKNDVEILKRFKGEFPPTVARLMAGIGVAPKKGFHQIAMQLAITANALGKSSDKLVEACEGLCQTHESDSPRYNSPRKRKEELRRMWEYTHDSPVYEFSAGGIKSLCDLNTSTPDIDALAVVADAKGNAPDGDTEEEDLPEDLKAEIGAADSTLLENILILQTGIYRRAAEGSRKISNICLRSPKQMLDLEDSMAVGLEVEVLADKVNLGRHIAHTQVFRSRSSLADFCAGRRGIFSGTDTQAGAVLLLLSRKAMKDKNVVYIVRKEGLDIVQNPLVTDRASYDTLWVSSDKVLVVGTESTDTPAAYKFQPKLSSSPVFNTDLHLGHKLEDTPEVREWLGCLLTMNSPTVLAQMLGWFVSCFHKQFYHRAYSQFPLLHPNGTAGSGKTLTTRLLAGMFYVAKPVVEMGCSQNSSTAFSLKSAWTSSASIPVILDEYKPSELGQVRYDFLLQHFRLLYNQGSGGSGGVNRGGADSSFRDVTQFTFSAPTAYLGESQEMQTALVQRSIAVGFNSGDSAKHTRAFDVAKEGAENMPKLGALILELAAGETIATRREALEKVRMRLREGLANTVHERQVYNLAVVTCGIEFLGAVLKKTFGDAFEPHIKKLSTALWDNRAEISVTAMAESSKVLSEMALISRTESPDSEFALREGYEYVIGDGYIEILLKEAFVKYYAWSNRKGFKPLYFTPESFINSVGKNPAATDRKCFDSKLRSSPSSRVFRFSLDTLSAEGVELFHSKYLG